MNTKPATNIPLSARQCRMQGRRICLEIDTDRWLSFPASKHPVLDRASQADLELLQLGADGLTIRWESLHVALAVEDIAQKRFVPDASPALAQ